MKLASDVLAVNRHGKAAECELLTAFLQRLQIQVTVAEEAEQPDFFVTARGHKIGVELTLFHFDSGANGSHGRKQFEMWASVASALRERLNKAGIDNLYGSVFLKGIESQTLDQLNQSLFIEELTRLCQREKDYAARCRDVTDFATFSYLSSVIEKVHLDNGPANKLWWCAHLQSGSLDDPFPILDRIIGEKATKAGAYNWRDAEERWLVIVARALHLWDTGIISETQMASAKRIEQGAFDRVFFWDKFSENIWSFFPEMNIAMNSERKTLHINRLPPFFR